MTPNADTWHTGVKKTVSDVYVAAAAKMVVPTRWHAQTMHSHRPIELVAALDGPIEMRCGGGQTISSESFLVPPMRQHALQRYGGRVVRLYLDAGYRSVAAWKREPILTEFQGKGDLMMSLAHLFAADTERDLAFDTMQTWIRSWVTSVETLEPSDSRVAQVLQFLDRQGANLKADREEISSLIGLSPSRFRAIFAEDTGASLGRYLIWRRVKIALSLICGGESVTAAAAVAGFADGAHLTRSCHATYGFAPSGVLDVRMHTDARVRPGGGDGCLSPHPIVKRKEPARRSDSAVRTRS